MQTQIYPRNVSVLRRFIRPARKIHSIVLRMSSAMNTFTKTANSQFWMRFVHFVGAATEMILQCSEILSLTLSLISTARRNSACRSLEPFTTLVNWFVCLRPAWYLISNYCANLKSSEFDEHFASLDMEESLCWLPEHSVADCQRYFEHSRWTTHSLHSSAS